MIASTASDPAPTPPDYSDRLETLNRGTTHPATTTASFAAPRPHLIRPGSALDGLPRSPVRKKIRVHMIQCRVPGYRANPVRVQATPVRPGAHTTALRQPNAVPGAGAALRLVPTPHRDGKLPLRRVAPTHSPHANLDRGAPSTASNHRPLARNSFHMIQMPRARLSRRPCPRACHARATRRAHNGPSLAPIALVPAPVIMAAVTLRYTAQPVSRYPAQTTVLDFSVPDAGLGWHPRLSAPRLAAAHGSDRLYTCRPGDLAGGPRSLPDTTTTWFSLSALILLPPRPFLRWPGPALRRSPLHNRDHAVTGPGLSRGKSSPPHPDRALRAPTQDSDGTHATRRHVTQRCMARPGLTRTDSATVTTAPRQLQDTPRHGFPSSSRRP